MLAHRIPPEAELQPDLDVGAALVMELLGALEIICGEASLATGRSLGLAARGADGGLGDTHLGSDLADRHTRRLKTQDLLLLCGANRTTAGVADAAGTRSIASLGSRWYADRARFRSDLTGEEACAEGEEGLPVVCVDTAQVHYKTPSLSTINPLLLTGEGLWLTEPSYLTP